MSKNLRVIIPVAGAGTRLRPHTFSMPKSLIPVAGKPMLAHVLDPLIELEPVEVCLVVGHLGNQIRDYIDDNYKFKVTYVNQEELLGLGYAVFLALKELESGPVIVCLGDTIARTEFTSFVRAGENVIGLQKVADPRRFGIAIINDNKITAFEEKPQHPRSDLAIIGLYYFHDSAILLSQLKRLVELDKRTGGEIQLTDALEYMIQTGEVFTPYEVNGWYDCGKVETVLQTNRQLLKDCLTFRDYPGSVIIPPVYIAETAIIEESVVGPYVSISDGAVIKRSIIRDSIIFKEASVRQSALESSLIGERAAVKGAFRRLNIGESSGFGDFKSKN
jgi:glucose-1-phosphate thymidylyltransferase